MKEETFYGVTSKRGCINGNLFEASYGFNCMYFQLFVNHRVAQRTSISTDNTISFGGVSYGRNTDMYTYILSTKNVASICKAMDMFIDSIISIDKYVDLEFDNTSKVASELLRVLG